MLLVFSALIAAGVVAWACLQIARELKAAREQVARGRALQILTAFVPAVGAAHTDPRALLVWQPLARMARQLFPDEFAALDRASGATFPFSDERSEEHTSELQSHHDLVCRLLLEKKKKKISRIHLLIDINTD